MLVRGHRKQIAAALFAALALLLQSAGAAWAGSYAPALDAFGNPLCINDDVHRGGPHSGDRAGFANCCTLAGCGWTGFALAPGDAAFIVARERDFQGQIDVRAAAVPSRFENGQSQPRAPPVSI